MATNKINVVEKTPGTHIEYALSGSKKITFGDDELTINLASRERYFEVSLLSLIHISSPRDRG